MLLEQVAGGGEEAFTRLFHAWRDKLYYFLLRITGSEEQSEDVLQEVFVKVWVHRERLVEIQSFSAYLYRMAQNQAYSGMRRMALETLILKELSREATEAGQAVDEALLKKQVLEKLGAIIAALPPRQRMVYTLSREEGLRQEEIAERLHISVSTVQNHMTQALRTIRQQLLPYYPHASLYFLLLFSALSKEAHLP
jgi:RNA polymerase sigma-70 factor (ECF subfamily)